MRKSGITPLRIALQTIGMYDDTYHSEKALEEKLGKYDLNTIGNLNPYQLLNLLQDKVNRQEVGFSPQLSLIKALNIAENGGAAVIPLPDNTVCVIPPGNRMSRDEAGVLSIQVIKIPGGLADMPLLGLLDTRLPIVEAAQEGGLLQQNKLFMDPYPYTPAFTLSKRS